MPILDWDARVKQNQTYKEKNKTISIETKSTQGFVENNRESEDGEAQS